MATDWRTLLKSRMKDRGLINADICRMTGLNPSYMNKILKLEDPSEPSVTNLAKIARAVGFTLGELYEGDINSKPLIVVTGHAGSGDMWSEMPKNAARCVPLDVLSGELVAIEIATNEWAPRYQAGDIVCGQRSVGQNLHNLLGQDCIIMTADGARMIKYMTRGTRKNRYTLKAFLPTVDDLQDVQIKWAAPISLIIRNTR